MGISLRRQSQVAADSGVTEASVTHRRRNLAARPAWQASDLAIAGSLASLTAPAWLLPERSWPALCRTLARIPWLTDQSLLKRTAARLQAALGETCGVAAGSRRSHSKARITW
jgi:hypothetical protein